MVSRIIAVVSDSDTLMKFPFAEEMVWRIARGGQCLYKVSVNIILSRIMF